MSLTTSCPTPREPTEAESLRLAAFLGSVDFVLAAEPEGEPALEEL